MNNMNGKDDKARTSEERDPRLPALAEAIDSYEVDPSGEPILWRAALGGIAGYGLLALILCVVFSDSTWVLFLINPPLLFLPGAIGLIIGGALLLDYRKYRRNLGIIRRIVIGISIATGITWVMV